MSGNSKFKTDTKLSAIYSYEIQATDTLVSGTRSLNKRLPDTKLSVTYSHEVQSDWKFL